MALSVIGAGFGRTGTSALKSALEVLGFGPCCHGSESRHFRQHSDFWERVFNRQPIDWNEYFQGYCSTVDSPSCRLYLELSRAFPTARVILTCREPNEWFESYQATILPMLTASKDRRLFTFLFGSSRFDRKTIIEAYQRHNDEVRSRIPPERLLDYQVKDGWEPLCRFLDVAIPRVPFPCTNSRSEFVSAVESIGRQLRAPAI